MSRSIHNWSRSERPTARSSLTQSHATLASRKGTQQPRLGRYRSYGSDRSVQSQRLSIGATIRRLRSGNSLS